MIQNTDSPHVGADAAGEKVNGYIKKAIDERMERDTQNVE
jgi:hypothetical protein